MAISDGGMAAYRKAGDVVLDSAEGAGICRRQDAPHGGPMSLLWWCAAVFALPVCLFAGIGLGALICNKIASWADE
jgi:hypothetical protein